MSENVLCYWCGDVIKNMPLVSHDYKYFCHLACGKLYYDNIEKFSYNAVEYNNLFVENKLSPKAREVYVKVGHNMIGLLPYCECEKDKVKNKDYRADMRDKYIKLLKLIRR